MSATAMQSSVEQVVVDEFFAHAPAVIWQALTTGDLISRWMMAPTGFSPEEGCKFTFTTRPAGAWDGLIRCQVLKVVTEECLAYSWTGGDENNLGYGSKLDTVVTFTLTKVEGGTQLKVVHSGFVLPQNQTAFTNMGEGWPKVMRRLGSLAAEGSWR